MSHRALLFVSSAIVLLAVACSDADPTDPPLEARSGALARDLDGNPVYPDIPSTGSGGTSGGSGSCTAGSTANLIAADSFDYADHGEHTLTSSSFTLWLCITHFPIGSAARAEVEAAAALYNDVAGTPVSITVGAAGHQTIAQLFPTSPTGNFMDVVDNSTIGFPCHGAGDISPSSWTMNTCRHDSGGVWNSGSTSIDHFVISVNANTYTFDTVAGATDYPKRENVAHELGHAFGMNHTPDWPDADGRELLSTIQGNLPILASHDRGYLRHYYPGTVGSTLNLVASPQVRVPDASKTSGWDNRQFADVNPAELYLAGGTYYDCATHEAPVFQAQWLNHGQVTTPCTVKNRFRIGPAGSEDSAAKITIKAWEAAKMPAASQDRIETTVTIEEAKLAALAKDVPYDLTFKVDRDDAAGETDENDNIVTSSVTLRAALLRCTSGVTANHL